VPPFDLEAEQPQHKESVMPQLPGKFVWIEHVSTQPKKAQVFYGEVLGWKVEGAPMGDFTYEMIKTPEGTIGGYAQPQQGERPHWISYVSVDNVDATAKKVVAAGGKLLGEAFDIPTVGRMARVADPFGARFNLFTSSQGDPADAPARPVGHVDWNELLSPEPEKAAAFYEKVLGYSIETMDMPHGGAYRVLKRDGVSRAGLMKTPVPQLPSHWLQYLAVDDADAAIARATRAGGELKMPAMDVKDVGRFAVLTDPLGAAFGLIKPAAR
jgi:predicted enzyme related to lactoylglutathione lyase